MITYFFKNFWKINDKKDENAQLAGIAIVHLSDFFRINFCSGVWNRFCLEVLTDPDYPPERGYYFPSLNGVHAKTKLPVYSLSIENRETVGHEVTHFLHELINPKGFSMGGILDIEKLFRECIATIGEKRFGGGLKNNDYDAQRLIRLNPSEVYDEQDNLFKIKKELTN